MAMTLRAGRVSTESMAMVKAISSPDFAAIWPGTVSAMSDLGASLGASRTAGAGATVAC